MVAIRELEENTGKIFAFPDATCLLDIFDEVAAYSGESKKFLVFDSEENSGIVSSYCYVRDGADSASVTPSAGLLDYISKNMLLIKHDEIYFKAIPRSDGLLIVANYNVIIGSRWLALLPLSEMSNFPKEIEEE